MVSVDLPVIVSQSHDRTMMVYWCSCREWMSNCCSSGGRWSTETDVRDDYRSRRIALRTYVIKRVALKEKNIWSGCTESRFQVTKLISKMLLRKGCWKHCWKRNVLVLPILVELSWIASINGDAFEERVVIYLHENTRAPDTVAVIMHKGNTNNKWQQRDYGILKEVVNHNELNFLSLVMLQIRTTN